MTYDADSIELIRRALSSLRYGEIVISVHDGKVVQIARTEKLRPSQSTGRDEPKPTR